MIYIPIALICFFYFKIAKSVSKIEKFEKHNMKVQHMKKNYHVKNISKMPKCSQRRQAFLAKKRICSRINNKKKKTCTECNKTMRKQVYPRHVRKRHPHKMEELGVKPMKKHRPFPYSWIKQMVVNNIKNDKMTSMFTTKQKDDITQEIMDKLKATDRLKSSLANKPCYCDMGSYLRFGFDFHNHSLYQLSLDRIENYEDADGKRIRKAHFEWNEEQQTWLKNIRFVIKGLNHHTNPSSLGMGYPTFMRQRIRADRQSIDTEQRALLARLNKKSWNGKHILPYMCAYNIHHQRDASCKAQFETVGTFWDHAKQLLIDQGYRCPISTMLMRDTCDDSMAGSRMFAPSLDAIDATKGHVRGNLRWICSFLNCINHDKDKTGTFPDDRPTQWTKELFFENIRILITDVLD
jgi:hypothetical protein